VDRLHHTGRSGVASEEKFSSTSAWSDGVDMVAGRAVDDDEKQGRTVVGRGVRAP